MSNQTNDIAVTDKHSVAKINWGSVGILFAMIMTILLFCGFSYCYFQLSHENTVLARTVSALQVDMSHLDGHLGALQQSTISLQEEQEKIKKEQQPSTAQDQMAAELYKRLISIDNQIDQMPLLAPDYPAKSSDKDETPANNNQPASWWRVVWDRSWQALRKIVIVRNIGANTLPLIAPEEKSFLYQNLHAQIETAIWGALHHQAAVYQISLARSLTWIQRYFVQDAVETKTILQALQALQKIDVNASSTSQEAVSTTLQTSGGL